MSKCKPFFGIVLVLSVIIGTLTASAEDNTPSEGENLSNRIPLFTIAVGDGENELGYSGHWMEGFNGPSAFVLENGTVYILDTIHSRISVHDKNGWKYNIVLTDCPSAERINYQDGVIGVVDNQKGVTCLYSVAGELLNLIVHPRYVEREKVAELSEIGDTYVIWRTFQENYYMYDWTKASCEKVTSGAVELDTEFARKLSSGLMVSKTNVSSSVKRIYDPLGLYDGCIVYKQYEYFSDLDIFLGEYSLRKISADGQETYAIIDTSNWYAPPLDPYYVSSDGMAYVMENLEDEVMISQVVFGTTDVSQMPQLEEVAKERRQKMEAEMEAYRARTTELAGTHKLLTAIGSVNVNTLWLCA